MRWPRWIWPWPSSRRRGSEEVFTTKDTKSTKEGAISLDPRTEAAAREIVDAALKVHRALGPGLLESVYEHCLAYELGNRGVACRRQAALPIVYDGVELDAALRLDLIVDDRVIVEIKSVETLAPIHDAQLLTYLKLSRLRLGFLINFNSLLLKQGVKRLAL